MNPLNSIWGTIISGIVIAAAIAAAATSVGMVDSGAVVILIHVAVGITWIGLLYYFNFVQVPGLAEAAADEGGPGRRRHLQVHRPARAAVVPLGGPGHLAFRCDLPDGERRTDQCIPARQRQQR